MFYFKKSFIIFYPSSIDSFCQTGFSTSTLLAKNSNNEVKVKKLVELSMESDFITCIKCCHISVWET